MGKAKNDNITRDPAAAARKSKRGKSKLNQLKDKIGVDRTNDILVKIEENINKAINDKKLWFEATKAFADYYKPRKRETDMKLKGTVILQGNPKILNDKNSQKE